MENKKFSGDAIYNPSGKAKEYSYWACNFYVGCSNGCDYCYLKKGRGKKHLGGNIPTLKKCFRDEAHALQVFEVELFTNLCELRQHGLFFTFTSDPFLPETYNMTIEAVAICQREKVPVKILTKMANWCLTTFLVEADVRGWDKSLIAIGFTLTGCDEREPFATPNERRADQLHLVKNAGYRTFASFEPILDFEKSTFMMFDVLPVCDLFKIGLESGSKNDRKLMANYVKSLTAMFAANRSKVYFKDSILRCAKIDRESLPDGTCVAHDYNIFNQ